ncbi:MAG: hypothetical protein H0V82_01835 [Candidatus Protochlamydia sp.]|nr:hypothetical protein [Candidatus Protochlamydia sp.]
MNTVNNFNNLSRGQIGPIKEIGSGLYTAEAIAPTGEQMYFAMEPIEDSDSKKWDIYRNTAASLIHGERGDSTIGSLTQLGSRINDENELNSFLLSCSYPEYWTSEKSLFKQLKENLLERKIVVDSPKAKELSMIPYASNGINVSKQTHIVYASKKPVLGRAVFKSPLKGFGRYSDCYGSLIMCVGVTTSDIVENRGIFKNPLSVVEGGFGGISMMAHSFTCMAVENFFPLVTTFRVRPLKKMGEIFLASLPKDQVTVEGIRGDNYTGGFEFEKDVRVPVKVLASLHRAT